MSFATKCVCDGCGKIKGDANKWLLGYDFLLLNPKGSDVSFFGVAAWSDNAAYRRGVLHLCGDGCMQKMMSEHLAKQKAAGEI